MKKLTMLFAGILFAGFSFAQTGNTSTTTQLGTSHYADVDQSGDYNSSEIMQDQGFNYDLANGSIAEVDQIGDDNESYIKSWGWNHEVYVMQEGDENASGVNQSGGENEAYVDQTGDGNTVKGLGTSANAYQKAGDPFGADKSIFDVDQIGDDNTVEMWQEHSATATVYQEGDMNMSTVKQTGAPYGPVNSATISIFGDENTTDMLQNGDGNTASAFIGAYLSDYNMVDMDQVGNGNYASFGVLKGDDNDIKVDQLGDHNYTEFSVKYGDDNHMYSDVDGSDNRTRFHIKAAWGAMSDGNDLDITKDGDYNYIAGSIEGDGNDVDLSQVGTSNRIGTSWYTNDGVVIVGDYNDVDVMQTGTSNSAFVNVTGDNNISSTIQH